MDSFFCVNVSAGISLFWKNGVGSFTCCEISFDVSILDTASFFFVALREVSFLEVDFFVSSTGYFFVTKYSRSSKLEYGRITF